jgi:nucleotide-binding universal stress UspA family protein
MMSGSMRIASPLPSGTDGVDVAAGAGRIVVGVDGSTGSIAALQWAAEEAERRGVEVLAVMAWQLPAEIGTKIELAVAAEAEIARIGAKIAEKCDVMVVCEAVEGQPAVALVHAALGAELLVVGTHGHGGFLGALLGSVSHHVIAHATCPVVVVPDPSHRRAAKA